MRLWSLSPALLDSKGLVALWRETLLAQKVLQGRTKGYKHHPQLTRFKATQVPLESIDAYLSTIATEATKKCYKFNLSKIGTFEGVKIKVTSGQLQFELDHLLKKLETRDPKKFKLVASLSHPIPCNPLFEVIEGDIEPWEKLEQKLPKI